MKKIKSYTTQLLPTRFGPALLLFSIFLLFNLLTRTILTVISLNKLDFNLLHILLAFVIGFFYDLVTGLFFIAPLFLYLWLCPSKIYQKKWQRYLLYAYFVTSLVILVFNVCGEIIFWQEYGNRYDFIAVDYLVYTQEVIGNIIESYPIFWILAAILIVAASLFYFCKRFIFLPVKDTRFGKRSLVFSAYATTGFLAFFFLTNTFRFFSKNNYVNEIAGNGLYEFGTAYLTNSIDFYKKYHTLSDTAAFVQTRTLLQTKEATYTGKPAFSITRNIRPDSSEIKANIVLISVESLSANFMHYFGGEKSTTPVLDSLISQSLFCSNMYATGTRTVRGLEALSLAIPPTPGQSIVRRPKNKDLFTIGNLLTEKGYACKFIYGGNSFFDNMGPYFSANGYKVVDSRDFSKEEVHFTTTWGACDEDIFNKAMKECEESYQQQKLFYTHVMTVSNHRPYTFPKGKIEGHNPDDHSREGAVAYTDWAIGNFLKQAAQKPWFNQTIFVIVADHCASAAGKVELPVTGYHIPALVYAPALVKPQVMNRLMSQIDLIPTVLGLLHFPYNSKFMGYDMFQLEAGRERAFISTYQKLGYIKNNKLVILGPKKTAEVFQPDFKTGTAAKLPADPALIKEAISWYQTASYLFTNGLYKN